MCVNVMRSLPDDKAVPRGRILTLYSRNVQKYWTRERLTSNGTSAGKTGARFIGEDSQSGRRLGPYSCRSTLLQLFVIGEGIDP